MSQTKLSSFLEACGNVSLGWGLSVVVGHFIIYPLFNIDMSLSTNMGATTAFTVLSVIKTYAVRRYMNWHQHHRGE
jgi:uncharacterized membrane protein